MADLKTDFKNDTLDGNRKYQMINNSDGTVSFVDVTQYTQKGDTFGANEINTTNEAINQLDKRTSHIGMIIHTTTLDTEDKVKAIYGGTKWISHSGYMLRGASSDVVPNSNVKTGGADSHTHTTGNHTLTLSEIPSHSHSTPKSLYLQGTNYAYNFGTTNWGNYHPNFTDSTGSAGGGGAHNHGNTGSSSNLPDYKSVYIWERVS